MPEEPDRLRFHRGFVLLLAVAITAAFLAMIRDFWIALLLAAVVTGMSRPLHRVFVRRLPGRESLAALATVVLVVLFILLPLLGLAGIVVAQAVQVSESVAPWVQEQVQPGGGRELLERIQLPDFVAPYRDDLLARAGRAASAVGSFFVNALTAATRGTVQFLFLLFVMIYAVFFFLRDGKQYLALGRSYLPLTDEEIETMEERFRSVSRATVKGTLVIGLVQGFLGGLAFGVAGVEGAAFWGTVMAVLSIIPAVGSALVWVPAAIFLGATGHLLAAIGMSAWFLAVVGTADNVLRPMLVGKDTRMSDLMVLLSTLGGLALFGAAGIVIGPMVAALFVTVWQIYGVAFRGYLPRALVAPGDGSG